MICPVCNALESRMSSKGKTFLEPMELFRLVRNREEHRLLRESQRLPRGRGGCWEGRSRVRSLPGGRQG